MTAAKPIHYHGQRNPDAKRVVALPKRSAREHQRRAAKKILAAMKRGSGTALTPDEVYHLWAGLMDALDDFAFEPSGNTPSVPPAHNCKPLSAQRAAGPTHPTIHECE